MSAWKLHLSPIRPGEDLILYTDTSISCLGFLLCQERQVWVDGKERTIWDFINIGSTALTDTQARHSPLQLEALSVQWACSKNHFYLAEAPVVKLFTDSSGVVGLLK